jgi:uncharacterized protein YegL
MLFRRKYVLPLVALAGLGLALAGCFKSPTDPFNGGTGSHSSAGAGNITDNTADHTTTSISAVASQVTSKGVYCSIANQTGSAISSSVLSGANFQVTYNGKTIPAGSITLSTASGNGQAISSSLVLDYSGSMYTGTEIADLEAGATAFVNNMSATDRGEIIKFDTSIVVMQPFTNNAAALRAAIADDTSHTFGGSTALFDAIWQGIQDTSTQSGQKAVVTFTDGYENSSLIVTSESDLISRAKSHGIPIFTIGLGSADTVTLQDISQQTNGRFYSAPTTAQLAAIYQQIAQIFSNTVIISWPSFTYVSGATINLTVTYVCATGTYTSTTSIVLP